MSPEMYGSFDRYGDKLEVIIRDSSFRKLFRREININNSKDLERLLIDLKDKGVDIIGLIKKKMIDDSGWFD